MIEWDVPLTFTKPRRNQVFVYLTKSLEKHPEIRVNNFAGNANNMFLGYIYIYKIKMLNVVKTIMKYMYGLQPRALF